MVAYLAPVEVVDLALWVGAIEFADWPQQHRLADGKIRPSMVTDLGWHDFGTKTDGIVHQLMERFPGKVSEQRMLSVVMPGHSIEQHRDQQPPRWLCRVHVPLISNEAAYFVVDGSPHVLQTGSAYCVDTRREHAVRNDGDIPRIHFMFDVRDP